MMARPARPGSGSRGFALVMTLIVLVVLTISALSMMLLMKAGVSAAGNIAFRQAAVRVADLGIEDARSWLKDTVNPADLVADIPTHGYYATTETDSTQSNYFSPESWDFTNPNTTFQYGGANQWSGYTVYYVVHRMASQTGACSAAAYCLMPPAATSSATGAGSSHGGGQSYVLGISAPPGLVYYRVTVKVVGPRFNNRYVQAFFY